MKTSVQSLTWFSVLVLVAISSVNASSNNPPGFPRGQAPEWSGVAVRGHEIVKLKSSDYKGKYLVLLFYPFDFTYVCPTEIIAFSENYSRFTEIGADVVGISVDSQFTHLAWIKTARKDGGVGKLNYPLFADVSKEVSRNYGVLVTNSEDELFGASLRGLFIIDGNGVIRHMQITDAPVGRDVDETLRLIKAFKYVDTHGEVCPHGWKQGQKTIKPTPDQKGEYFGEVYQKESDL